MLTAREFRTRLSTMTLPRALPRVRTALNLASRARPLVQHRAVPAVRFTSNTSSSSSSNSSSWHSAFSSRLAAALGGALALSATLYLTTDEVQLDAQRTKSKDLIPYAEVQKHNTPDDCWVVIGDKVYDLTKVSPLPPLPPLADTSSRTSTPAARHQSIKSLAPTRRSSSNRSTRRASSPTASTRRPASAPSTPRRSRPAP